MYGPNWYFHIWDRWQVTSENHNTDKNPVFDFLSVFGWVLEKDNYRQNVPFSIFVGIFRPDEKEIRI